MSDSWRPHGLYSSWNSPGQNTGVGSLSLCWDLPNPGIEPRSPTLQADSLPAELPGKPQRQERWHHKEELCGEPDLSGIPALLPTACVIYSSYLTSLFPHKFLAGKTWMTVFASLHYSHGQMWELGHKEGWALKNWCFQTVALEKTLESLLDRKKIKPVHPKGNQHWIFTERTEADVEAPMLCLPDVKSRHPGKDPDPGKNWGQKGKGQQRMRWLDGTVNSTDMNLSKLWKAVKGREAWHAAGHGVAKDWMWLSTHTHTKGLRPVNFLKPIKISHLTREKMPEPIQSSSIFGFLSLS